MKFPIKKARVTSRLKKSSDPVFLAYSNKENKQTNKQWKTNKCIIIGKNKNNEVK